MQQKAHLMQNREEDEQRQVELSERVLKGRHRVGKQRSIQ